MREEELLAIIAAQTAHIVALTARLDAQTAQMQSQRVQMEAIAAENVALRGIGPFTARRRAIAMTTTITFFLAS